MTFNNQIYATEGESSRWGRMDFTWTEQALDAKGAPKKDDSGVAIIREHHYTPIIDRVTKDIYMDCGKAKLWGKFFAHTISRPFLMGIDEIYHVKDAVVAPFAAIKTYFNPEFDRDLEFQKQGELGKKCLYMLYRPIRDLIATPVYGTAMLVTSAAALVIGAITPSTLYDFRAVMNKLLVLKKGETKWMWTERDIFRCMTPLANLDTMAEKQGFARGKHLTRVNTYLMAVDKSVKLSSEVKKSIKESFKDPEGSEKLLNLKSADTIYPKDVTAHEVGKSNFVRAQIFELKGRYLVVERPQGKLGKEAAYISAAYEKVQAEQRKAVTG